MNDGQLRARRLRSLREARGWTQLDLERESGLSRGVILDIEKGQYQGSAFESFIKIAKALDVFATDDGEMACPPPLTQGKRRPKQNP